MVVTNWPMCLVCNSVDNTFVLTLIQHANEQLCHARQTYLSDTHEWLCQIEPHALVAAHIQLCHARQTYLG